MAQNGNIQLQLINPLLAATLQNPYMLRICAWTYVNKMWMMCEWSVIHWHIHLHCVNEYMFVFVSHICAIFFFLHWNVHKEKLSIFRSVLLIVLNHFLVYLFLVVVQNVDQPAQDVFKPLPTQMRLTCSTISSGQQSS